MKIVALRCFFWAPDSYPPEPSPHCITFWFRLIHRLQQAETKMCGVGESIETTPPVLRYLPTSMGDGFPPYSKWAPAHISTSGPKAVSGTEAHFLSMILGIYIFIVQSRWSYNSDSAGDVVSLGSRRSLIRWWQSLSLSPPSNPRPARPSQLGLAAQWTVNFSPSSPLI